MPSKNDSFEYDHNEWRQRALCKNSDPDLFFPGGYSDSYADQIEATKGFCGICAVNGACLEFALATREESGIWGGTTPDERKVMLRSRRQHAV